MEFPRLATACTPAFILLGMGCEPQLLDEDPTHDDMQAIWDDSCVDGCHEPGGDIEVISPFVTLEMHEGAYENMVGVPSDQLPTMNIVEPGSHEDSYLWHKLNDTHQDVGGAGLLMPFGLAKLPQDDLDLIKRWINDGAPE